MVYILVIMITAVNPFGQISIAAATAEFNSEANCQYSAKTLVKNNQYAKVYCFQKGTKQ